MSYIFEPAVRKKTSLLIGIAGPTGSGKTYSALRLATGLAQGGKIIAGDTERGRLSEYADEFKFLVADIKPPFRPQAYRQFLKDAYAQNPAVVLIDSATHEWTGEGGCLEWHDEICKEMSRRYNRSPDTFNFSAWGEPKSEHRLLIGDIASAPCHVILCFRAREKYEQVKGDKGKSEIINRGLCPEGAEDLPYEMSFLAVLEGERPGIPTFTYKPLSHKYAGIFEPGQQIGPAHGKKLAELAPKAAETPLEVLLTAATAEARRGSKALEAWWKAQPIANRKALVEYKDRLKSAAAEVDKKSAEPSGAASSQAAPSAVDGGGANGAGAPSADTQTEAA